MKYPSNLISIKNTKLLFFFFFLYMYIYNLFKKKNCVYNKKACAYVYMCV